MYYVYMYMCINVGIIMYYCNVYVLLYLPPRYIQNLMDDCPFPTMDRPRVMIDVRLQVCRCNHLQADLCLLSRFIDCRAAIKFCLGFSFLQPSIEKFFLCLYFETHIHV